MRLTQRSTVSQQHRGLAFTHPHLTLAVLAGLVALALSACGSGEASTAAAEPDVDSPTVTIEDMAFAPKTLAVEEGDTVTWVWNDGAIDHNVAGDDFQSEIMSEGSFSYTFDEPGTYDYACTLHPNMTGTIEVTR
ncbi:MAG: copper-binding protein [Actinobacteria bacterium]|nr:copper-binding protein [Actinomycetota bacterium]